MNIFHYSDYKAALRGKIASHSTTRGYKSKLAQAAGCQKSFFSRVLTSHVHLTPEHAFGLAEFWKLEGLERDYFLGLVDCARAGSPALREHLQQRLRSLKEQSEVFSRRFEQKQLPLEAEASSLYYSSWHYGAIHFLLTIPAYQSPRAIARRLSLSADEVTAALELLATHGLVRRNGDKWAALQKHLHVPRESHLSGINHGNWRQRAVSRSFTPNAVDLHYTALYSLSLADLEKIRQLMFQFIDESRRIVVPSAEEELICVTCDLFRV